MRDATRFIDGSYQTKKKRSKAILSLRSTDTGFRSLKKNQHFRLLSYLDSSLRSVAITMIGVYQRHISPRKGYSCAHRTVHGGDSCSDYVKNVLADKSLFESTLLARRRFRDCNIAHTSTKNRVANSKSSFMVLVVGEDFISIIISIIMWIITAILAFIFGRNSGCCNK